jgi:integrase
MLRHTAATNWVRAGIDLDVVQALLGHASLASTTVYLPAMRTSAARWKPSRPGSGTGERTRAAGRP